MNRGDARKIKGCDYHPSFQQIAFVDTETGELGEQRLIHPKEAEQFYGQLKERNIAVRVGMEASGHARWFERLLRQLQFELWIGDAAEIRTKGVRKQKTDRQDAQLLLRLIMEDRFPRIWVADAENRDLRQLLLHGATATSVAVDGSRNAFITGGAVAQGFPTTAASVQPTFGGGASDAFVTKFDRTGSALVYSTFFGGNGADIGNSIALDTAGHAFIAGTTSSTNLRVTPATMQSRLRGLSDAFLTEFYVAGTDLICSTYFGGSNNESGNDIAVDSLGTAYMTGQTQSADLKVTSGAFQQTNRGAPSSGFIAKLSPAADLALTKSASVTHAPIGGSFTYRLHALNRGPEPTLNVQLFDPLPGGVVFLSAAARGCDTLSTPAVGTRGDITCKRGFLKGNSSIDLTIRVQVEPPVGGAVLNEAIVFGDSFDPNGNNNLASATVAVP